MTLHDLRAVGALALLLLAPVARAQDCAPVDFLALPLPGAVPGGDPVEVAVKAAYPGVDLAAGRMTLPDGSSVAALPARGVTGRAALEGATLGDQFAQAYPLDFDLAARERPWFDPGRARDEAVFRALWFDSEAAARASLATVEYRGATVTASFRMTTRHCAAAQAAAALAEVAALGPEMDPFFEEPGGSFNWRLIAGTDRLSAHSFGTALDLNAELGGYWLWTGAAEGAVGAYDNRIPEALVRAFERRGFVWGGKWHHFDGMHFEYRPELILHARLTGG
jgi:hypothetical protein